MLKLFGVLALLAVTARVGAVDLRADCGELPSANLAALSVSTELDWLKAQRAIVDREKVNEAVRGAMAARAVVLLLEAARLDAVGEQANAARIKDAVKTQLIDTGWRLGFLARNGDEKARLALAWVAKAGLFAATGAAVPSAQQACGLFNAPELNDFAEARFQRAQCAANRNPNLALSELQAAAKRGHPAALDALGQLCLKATPPDQRCAITAFCAAARGGRGESATRAAWLLVNHDQSQPAAAAALKLYEFAAARNDASAQNGLGELFETGRSGKRNETLAATWYARAAMQRLPVAQYNLARMYADGRGVPRDRKRALTLAQASALAGFVRGREFEIWLRANP